MGSTAESPHSRTLGSAITLGRWHHLSISVLPVEMRPIYRVSSTCTCILHVEYMYMDAILSVRTLVANRLVIY